MKNRAPITVTSWEQLQERIVSIIAELNAEPELALAAAANPFAALEELGYHLKAEARSEIEDRLRFPEEEAAVRKELRRRIFEEVGYEFELNSAEMLRKVLYEELSITPYPDEHGCYPELPPTQPPRRLASGEAEPDPLRELEGRHAVIEPLLEYRRLDASHPQFAPLTAYEAIRNGEVSGGVQNLRVRLQRRGEEEPATPAARPTRRGSRAARLNINAASAAELEVLPSIGPRLAARVVAYREEHGPFETVEALGRVPGISEQLLTRLRPHVTTEP